jgi:hypothetical protein
MKILSKISIWILIFACPYISAQIKTKSQNITVNTGHASISLTLYYDGVGVECKVINSNPNVKYDIRYSVDYELVCGTNKKTISDKGLLGPNGEMLSLSQLISDCVGSDGKRTANSVRNAHISSFNATPVQENTNRTAENSNQSGNYNSALLQTQSGPPANAGLQELSEWQRKESGSTQKSSTNINALGAEERQQRLKSLQEEQKKAQQNAQYEKAVAYEQQRQQSIQRTNETITAVTGAITDFIYQQAEEKRKEREEEEERAALEYEQRMAEHNRKIAVEAGISRRKAALAEFPSRDIPLGSQEKALSIYYFIYAYDNSINNENGAVVYISNVFQIGRYKDGTRVYTATLKNDIAKLTPFAEVLHGYYYTEQEAEQLRQTLISLLQDAGVTIKDINYKGKPYAKSAVVKEEDFWGETKKTQSNAPARLNTSKPSELPREEKKKEKEKDFWD